MSRIDKLVDLAIERNAAEKNFIERFCDMETDDFRVCTGVASVPRVHIDVGIDALAKEAGQRVVTIPRGSNPYPWYHSFMYKEVEFFSISECEAPE